MMILQEINLDKKFNMFHEHWKPKRIAELNDSYLKLVKLKGEYVWHHHNNEDELLLVVKGRLTVNPRFYWIICKFLIAGLADWEPAKMLSSVSPVSFGK